MISITKKTADDFEVKVEAVSTTTHQVTLSDEYHKKLTDGEISKGELIEKSFAFLLKRESNSMILSEFDLSVIQNFFSDFERQIRT